MRRNFEKYFRAEHKLNRGENAKFPKITDKYWSRVVYLKRYKVYPQAGGIEDQSYKFIVYLNIVMETESAISIEQSKKKYKKS